MKNLEKFLSTVDAKKGLRNLMFFLYGFVHIFLYILTPKIPYIDYMLSVLELELSTEFECTKIQGT